MATLTAFNSTIAARTRTADLLLTTKDLLALYEGLGGLADDLEQIRSSGLEAEALNLAQSNSQAAGGAATTQVLTSFAALQKEYKSVMAVVQAVRFDLGRAGASAELLATMDRILVNEAEVTVTSVLDPAAPDGTKAKKKKAVRSVSQEALRAEIGKDAGALLGLDAAHAALAKRKVDVARLGALRDAAAALAGKLAERTSQKGAGKGATAAEREAVKAQKAHWGSCYRILAAAGRRDPRVAALLADAVG